MNTRNHAQQLYNALPEYGIKLHLSANMCARHRTEVIALIKHYLHFYKCGELHSPLWVVSTQLIEAGVDLDFPVVYRAMAGLDSIAQAAGRCNREGLLPNGKLGEVIVFRPENGAPAGALKQGQEITEELIQAGLIPDPLSPVAFNQYFRRFNTKGERDKYEITKLLTPETPTKQNPLAIEFRTAAEKFRMIDNNGIALVVPFIPLTQRTEKNNIQIIKSTELQDFFKQHLKNEDIDYWNEILSEFRYPDTFNEYFGESEDVALAQPFESWFSYLESDPLKHKWVYQELQRYTITISENELKRLPSKCIYERAGLLVLSSGYYDENLGALTLSPTLTPEQSIL